MCLIDLSFKLLALATISYLLLLNPEFGVYCERDRRITLFSDVRVHSELKGYNIFSAFAQNEKSCAMLCHKEDKCHSFNFCSRSLCELNSATSGSYIDRESWSYNKDCNYTGTHEECLLKETCNQENCSFGSSGFSEFHWGDWDPIYAISEESKFSWRKVMVRSCRDVKQNEVSKSNCIGCYRKATNERVLWVFTKLSWNNALEYCENKGGTLFGQFDKPVFALMDTFLSIRESPFDPTKTYWTGVFQNGNLASWKSQDTDKDLKYEDIFWRQGQPSNANGPFYVKLQPKLFRINRFEFMHDSPEPSRTDFVCTIRK